MTGLSGIKKGIRYIRKKYRSVGLKTQVLAYLFLLAFLPFVLIILYLWHYCSSSFSSTIRSSSLESYRTKARQIELYVDDFLQLADRIEEEGALAGIIGHDRNVSLTAYWIRQLMQGYALELYKDIEGVYILTGEGKEYLVSWFPEEYCLSLRNEARRKYAQLREIAERQAQGAEFYTQQSTFRGERCIAVRKWIFDGAGSACGSIVLLLAPDSLEEIANQISGENLPWGFRIGSTREALCVSPDYEALLDDGQTEECVIPRLGWTFSCVVNTGGMQQQALRKFALMLGLTILIYITIMYFVARAVNRQLKILYRLQAEMERVSREGTYRTLEVPAYQGMGTLFREFNKMVKTISRQELIILKQNEENLRSVRLQKTAELRAMELEINPHYLYNTLNCISGTAIEHRDYQVSRMLKIFSSNLVYILKDRYRPVPIRREIQWLEEYLSLQKERYGEKFCYEIDMEPELADLLIYKMLLQPFVENAILHGFAGMQSGGVLTVLVYREGETIRICIYDNGQGIAPEELRLLQEILREPMRETDGEIGIQNSCRRLQGYYGDRYQVRIESSPGEGTAVKIDIPVMEKE